MEAEEITKLVDGIYKNILDKFNPGARQMINAGKAYLKALHGAAAASRLYVEAITKLAKQAQQGTWGGSSDIGSALMQVVEVYKEIQAQQMNILKAFYVDLLVPLETNLEKDTKVVQSEQKKFMQQHKIRSESYSKAAANMKKYRKKGSKTGGKTGSAMDKELKNMQILEEEKSKLDTFCEQSLKNALTQERRRYGFVLERQCSLAKHYLAYHNAGVASYVRHLEDWQEVARTREYIPETVDSIFSAKLRQLSFWQDDETASSRINNTDEDGISVASQLRKTKSMDASCLDVRSINDVSSVLKPLSRAKSEYNLNSSTHSLVQEERSSPQRPKSMALPDKGTWETPLTKALYAYLSSGDNQLSFLEGDIIALAGERNKGWQFGENLRTQCSGWFPLAYTEPITDDNSICSPSHPRLESINNAATTPVSLGMTNVGHISKPPSTMLFGDTIVQRRLIKQTSRRPITTAYPNLGPPPSLPAPVPELIQSNLKTITSAAVHAPVQTMIGPRGDAATLPGKRRTVYPPPMPPLPLHLGGKRANGTPGSLHSSNDSGFSNDPPPQPEVDYSDDDSARTQQAVQGLITNGAPDPGKKEMMSSVRGWLLYKSALDLWDDVNEQSAAKHQGVSRTLSVRQNVENGGTLGRFNSHDLLKTTPVAIEKVPEIPARINVKRAKSLWKFKRANKSEILEGMSLWKHRSLIDVRTAKDEDEYKLIRNKGDGEKGENIYASADTLLQSDNQKQIEKRNNEKNMRKNHIKSETQEEQEEEEEEIYLSDENFGTYGIDDGADSVIVVNDHVNLTVKRKNIGKYGKNSSGSNENTIKASNQSDISHPNVFDEKCKSEMSNSRSDLSDDTDTETIRKESFLPRMKITKSNSNDLAIHYIEGDLRQKEFPTWNVNSKVKEIKKWQEDSEGGKYFKEKATNKLKDNPNLFQEQLRSIKDNKAKCGPWNDLWAAEAPVKS